MHLLLVGLSHRVAGVELREKAALAHGQPSAALRELTSRPAVDGALVLATCGRTEVYVSGLHLSALANSVRETLEKIHPEGYPAYAPTLYRRADREAAHHLFRVAAGLDSLLVGEPEVLGQVRAAVKLARSERALDKLLGGTADRAIAAARRARGASGLGRRAPTVGSAASRYLAGAGLSLEGASALVIGAGDVGQDVALQLAGKTRELVIASRTAEHSEALAARCGARPAPLRDLKQLVGDSDLAVFSASTEKPLLRARDLRGRDGRPLVILDLGVPRNVEPEAGAVDGVTLVGVDEVSRPAAASEAGRAAMARAEVSLEEDLDGWSEWFALASIAPTLAAMSEYADGIRQAELSRAIRGLELDARQARKVEALSRSLVKKLLLHPISYLRANPEDRAAADLLTRVFATPPDREP